MTFVEFFHNATGFLPYDWQRHVAEQGFVDILPVPTGLGKTEGAVLAWAWRRLEGKAEPRHLVYCLPMRALVRQTVERLRACFGKVAGSIKVYQLMGGAIEEEWVGLPERPWVLVGTQDQLLSRALNRGYAMSRFEWPVQFGILNNDCRWIIDEVQLMGPGLWTTAQLDWMRKKRFGTFFDCPTTWMSATVETSFLATRDRERDHASEASSLPQEVIANDSNPEIRRRRGARKAIERWEPSRAAARDKARKGESGLRRSDYYRALARAVSDHHVPATLSLVVCNTVEAAHRVFENLPDGQAKVLLTSRFRRQDRETHEKRVLDFENRRRALQAERDGQPDGSDVGRPVPEDAGLICVSTQVIEAGVDISAHHLWSEVAPWPAVIQRLGRLNRDGRDQQARVWFWEAPQEEQGGKRKEGRRVGPYEREDIDLAWRLIDSVAPLCSQKSFAEALDDLARTHKRELDAVLQAKREPLPRAFDVHGLFSTERDVHGGFTDISAFVRGTDMDADLMVVWRDWEAGAKKAPPQGQDLDGPPLDASSEGCPVPFYRLRDALKTNKARAWVWNEEEERWEEIRHDDLRPGMVVMLHREAGGYSSVLGWTGDPSDTPGDVPRAGRGRALRDDDRTERGCWVGLAVHLADAEREADALCQAIGLQGDLRKAVIEAARLHDLGKAHPQWQQALPARSAIGPGPWAKCPSVFAVDALAGDMEAIVREIRRLRPGALRLPDELRQRDGKEIVRLRWAVDQRLDREEAGRVRRAQGVVWAGHVPFRPGLRHEAASCLAMWHRYRRTTGSGSAPYPALAVYLVAAHHGKVRTVFRSLTEAGDDAFGVPADSAPLEVNGEQWCLDFSVAKDGAEGAWREGVFELTGHGWTGLVADLLGPWRPDDTACAGVVPTGEPRGLGPFKLAYLEALVRLADWRASEKPSSCVKPWEVSGAG